MNLPAAIRRLSTSAATLERLMTALPADQVRWKPAPNRWSVLEVACHLLDEEREDFRQRLGLLLEERTQPWPAIDPQGWPQSRGYLERELEPVVADFLAERRRSLAWLGTLGEVDWQVAYPLPAGRAFAGRRPAGRLAGARSAARAAAHPPALPFSGTAGRALYAALRRRLVRCKGLNRQYDAGPGDSW